MTKQPHFPIPLTIISGFLGAGKTTLLNHVLHGDDGLRMAVLVNDFGAINIDSQLVVGVEEETVKLSNGCICCTIRDDLFVEVVRLLKRPEPPEYIIIETSGVSDPAAVAMTFLMPDLQDYIAVDSILSVIDAEQLLTLDDEFAELASAQINVADMVVLNKIDCVTPDQLAAVRRYILELVPEARILETSYGIVPLEVVLGVSRYDPQQITGRTATDVHVHGAGEDHEHERDHTLVFRTWSWRSAKPFTMSSLRTLVEKLPNTVYRAKGVVYLQDYPEARFVVQVVGRRASLMMDKEWGLLAPTTQMVFIGGQGGIDTEQLNALLDEALVVKVSQSRTEQILEMMELERSDYIEI